MRLLCLWGKGEGEGEGEGDMGDMIWRWDGLDVARIEWSGVEWSEVELTEYIDGFDADAEID